MASPTFIIFVNYSGTGSLHAEDRIGIRLKRLELSHHEYAKIPPRGNRGSAKVKDINGRTHHLRRASCGIPRCLCALAFVR